MWPFLFFAPDGGMGAGGSLRWGGVWTDGVFFLGGGENNRKRMVKNVIQTTH